MSININCPGCGSLINSIAPTCIYCHCNVKATQARQEDNETINHKRKVKEVKRTVDIVFFRLVLLSFLLFMARESVIFLIGSYNDYSSMKASEHKELELRIANEQAQSRSEMEAKKRETKEFNDYYNSEYRKYQSGSK
jgi:hypothetical protein